MIARISRCPVSDSASACHPSSLLAIVSAMLSPSALPRRLLAVMLTVCFFWIPVACMTLCSESGDEPASCATLLPEMFSPDQHEDCCPITTALPSALPEHRVTALPGDSHQATQISTVRLVGHSFLKLGHVAIPVSNSDPPLERLCALRI